MTHLVNNMRALLGFLNTILPPHEPGIWATSVDDIQKQFGFTIHVFEPIQSVRKGQTVYYPKTLRVLVQKLRNGLAHDTIVRVNQNRVFVGVKIRNFHPQRGKLRELDTDVEFTYDELKKFGLFLADEYLKV